MLQKDLSVQSISSALKHRLIDVVVCGSIGAIESVRLIRQLRRLGADVQVWMSPGAHRFTTETALAWASARPVHTNFSGDVSHLCSSDACVIAPASASFLSKLNSGITDSQALALCTSALGQSIPVLVLANMHESLYQAPAVKRNVEELRPHIHLLEGRQEESKQKFPDPHTLANDIAHVINKRLAKEKLPSILLTMGSTRGYIDRVRYISNYSSGALGSITAEECYRRGWHTSVVSGPCSIKPKNYSRHFEIDTHQEMQLAVTSCLNQGSNVAIMAASVLDFTPTQTFQGKISSQSQLSVSFQRTEKIIGNVHPSSGIKIGFKLEAELSEAKIHQIAETYSKRYNLSAIVVNCLSDVDSHKHKAVLAEASHEKLTFSQQNTKLELARAICDHIEARFK